jgi:K+-transporting ATPase KdpF subunit
MADVWVLLLIVAFFALCVAFVRGCDRIIGPDDAEELEPSPPEEVPGRRPVSGENIAGLVLAILLGLYLVAALLFPERF